MAISMIDAIESLSVVKQVQQRMSDNGGGRGLLYGYLAKVRKLDKKAENATNYLFNQHYEDKELDYFA